MVNVSWVGNIVKVMYSDKITIYRYDEEVDDNGVTIQTIKDDPTLSDINCLISFTKQDTSKTTLVSDIPVEMAVQLFTTLDAGIRAGDHIVASKMNGDVLVKTYTGIAGEPYTYPSHLQTALILDEVDE